MTKADTNAVAVQDCFACGKSYVHGEDRFCSTNCRAAYDEGFPAYQPVVVRYTWLDGRPMPISGDGFLIACRGCGKDFTSRGSRCCTPECDRKFRERQETAAVMAEVGMERAVKRKCVTCGSDIPRYVGTGKARRQVPISRVTCSPKCQKKRRMAADTETGDMTDEAA
jgi:hypothetical protein